MSSGSQMMSQWQWELATAQRPNLAKLASWGNADCGLQTRGSWILWQATCRERNRIQTTWIHHAFRGLNPFAIPPMRDSNEIGFKKLKPVLCYCYNYNFVGLPLDHQESNERQFGEEAEYFGIASSIQVQFPIIQMATQSLMGKKQNNRRSGTRANVITSFWQWSGYSILGYCKEGAGY